MDLQKEEQIRTLGGEQPVDLAEQEHILGLEQLYAGKPDAAAILLLLGDVEADKGNMVAWVGLHDVGSTRRPVQPLHPPTRVLDHHGRHLRCLAVSHLPLPTYFLSLRLFGV